MDAGIEVKVEDYDGTYVCLRSGKGKEPAEVEEHARQRSQCKECGGASICQHNRQRGKCKECGGGSICQHNRIMSRCKTCRADKDESMPPDLEEL